MRTCDIFFKLGAHWKELFSKTPFIVRHVFKNNFKTPVGITAISAGLQGLPICLYIIRHFQMYFNEKYFFRCIKSLIYIYLCSG